jgi:hypothetical protein
MTALESWKWRDPAKVYERIEAQEQAKLARSPETKQEQARRKLEELFKEPPSDVDNK